MLSSPRCTLCFPIRISLPYPVIEFSYHHLRWRSEGECRVLSCLGFDPDSAPMMPHDPPADRGSHFRSRPLHGSDCDKNGPQLPQLPRRRRPTKRKLKHDARCMNISMWAILCSSCGDLALAQLGEQPIGVQRVSLHGEPGVLRGRFADTAFHGLSQLSGKLAVANQNCSKAPIIPKNSSKPSGLIIQQFACRLYAS